jgi:hypothetical protein
MTCVLHIVLRDHNMSMKHKHLEWRMSIDEPFRMCRLWFHTYSCMISTITLCSNRYWLNLIVNNPWTYEWSIMYASHSRLWEPQHEVLPVKHNHITELVSLTWCYYVLLVVLILSPSPRLVPTTMSITLSPHVVSTIITNVASLIDHQSSIIFFTLIINHS